MKHSRKNWKGLFLMLTSLVCLMFFVDGTFATSVGGPVLDRVEVSSSPHLHVWSCGERLLLDDETEPGRISQDQDCYPGDGCELIERWDSYLFEGEQFLWDIVVLNTDGVDQIDSVDGVIGLTPTIEDMVAEVNCHPLEEPPEDMSECDTDIGGYEFEEFDPEIMAHYKCLLTVETSDSMYGEYWVNVMAEDSDGRKAVLDEYEYWYLNPIIGLSIDSEYPFFDDLVPGETHYSPNIYVGNAADEGSGVLMDIFISGTDFHSDPEEHSYCPEEGTLGLDRFSFYAENRGFDTTGLPDADEEGYRPLGYGEGFHDPYPFYDAFEVIPKDPLDPPFDVYYGANIIGPDDEVDLKLKVDVPSFCEGEFGGAIYFWGEAI